MLHGRSNFKVTLNLIKVWISYKFSKNHDFGVFLSGSLACLAHSLIDYVIYNRVYYYKNNSSRLYSFFSLSF